MSVLSINLDRAGPLLSQAAAGDRAALSALYLELRPPVVALCRRFLQSTGEAEEAAAEVLLRLDRLARDYDGRIDFRQWVERAASNYCIDLLRRRTVEQRWLASGGRDAATGTTSPADSPIAALIAAEDRTRLRDAIDQLPDAPRAALVLRYYEDLSYAEIAERMNVPIATVGTHLFRAKAELRSRLRRTWAAQGEHS